MVAICYVHIYIYIYIFVIIVMLMFIKKQKEKVMLVSIRKGMVDKNIWKSIRIVCGGVHQTAQTAKITLKLLVK